MSNYEMRVDPKNPDEKKVIRVFKESFPVESKQVERGNIDKPILRLNIKEK